MGGKDSKPVFLTYEDACRRVSEPEAKRLRGAFKRSSTLNGYMMKNVFFREVLGDGVPPRLSEEIFKAFGGTAKGVSWKDLVCGIVLLTRGTQEEKIKFIFGVYADENYTHISKTEMDQLVLQMEGTIPRDLAQLFFQSDQVSYEMFAVWAKQHADALSLMRWLLKDTVSLSMSNELQTPTFYQTLAGVTHLEESDIIELEKQYWQLKSLSKTGRFDMDTFLSIVCPPLPKLLCQGLFWAFDENQDNHIDFKELACGISACCRGPTVERQKFCFKIFDSDHNGLLSTSELNEMMSAMLIATDSRIMETEEIPSGDKMTQEILDGFDLDNDGSLTQEEYLVWAVSQPLPSQFLNILVQICHVVLGLKPQNKEEERDVMMAWLSRDEKQGFQQGQTWYLVALPWWRQWMEYLFYQPNATTTFDGSVTSNGIRLKPNNSVMTHSWTHSLSLCPSIIRRPSMEPGGGEGAAVGGIAENLTPKFATVPRSIPQHQQQRLSYSAAPGVGSSGVNGDNISVSTDEEEGGGGGGGMSQSMFSSYNQFSSNASTPSGSPRIGRHSNDVSRPGAIDNSMLVVLNNNSRVITLTNEGGILKKDRVLVRGRDFEAVSEAAWKALSTWYGKSSLALPRTVIIQYPGASPELELHPIQVKLLRYQIVNQRPQNVALLTGMVTGINASMVVGTSSASPRRYLAYTATFSRKHTLRQIHDFLTARLKLSREDMRLWKLKDEQNMILLEEDNKMLEELYVTDNSQILIEVRNKDLTWPEELSQLAKNKALVDKSQTATERGATGLNNLGNTCFMNSALQCMSNTYILTVYFTSGMHLYELNRSNPLGTQGNVAQRYGELVKDLWSGTAKSIAPLKLRWTIGKFAPCFNGFQQHDSQELLAFVLDRLHEDLNRVHDKPYVELKDSDGRPDEIVAKEAWDNHLLRNQSIIVDLFHGQLKSRVRCIECGHTSVKFDPFTFLSLPLPMDSCIHLEVIVVCTDESCPVKYGLRVNIDEKYRGLKKQLSLLSSIPASQLLLVDVLGALVRSFPQDNAKVKIHLGGSLFAYELPPSTYSIPPTMSVAEEKTSSVSSSSSPAASAPQQSTPSHHAYLSHIQGGLSQIQRLHARQQTSTGENLPPIAAMATDSDTVLETVPALSSSGTSSNSFPLTSVADVNGTSSVGVGRTADSDALPFSGFIIAVHRKMIHLDVYFLSSQKFRSSLFGIPMIISCDESTSHHNLYQQIWSLVSRLVSPLPPSEITAPNHAHDCDDSLGYEYPFTLKAVQKDGLTCAFCPWYRFCRGCTVNCGPQLFNSATSYLAVDWEPTALHLRYHASQEKVFQEHESLEMSRRLQTEPIGLDTCLNAFIREEELGEEELYYCSKCKTHRLAAKKLELWSLPPILIIHLKRFQFHNGRWVKSQKIVKFPFRDFDPTSYLVPRKKPSTKMKTTTSEFNSSDDCDKDITIEHNNCNNNKESLRLNSVHAVVADHGHDRDDSDRDHGDRGRGDYDVGKTKDDDVAEKRTEIANGKPHFVKNGPTGGSSTNCGQMSDDDYHNVRYNLYALSCHTGILGGGHYVTYAKNPNNKWYCYNDSSCKEVPEDQVDTNSAYILFYEREGLQGNQFMPDVVGREPASADNDEEFDMEFKKMCIIQ